MAPDGTSEFRLIGDDGTEHLLEGEQIVGRSEKCEITIDSPRVSRQHATFTTADDTVTLEDLGSANGTFVNGAQITAPTVLRHADRVCFEKNCFKFHGIVETDDDDDADVTMIGLPPDDSDVTVISPVAAAPEPEAPAAPAAAASEELAAAVEAAAGEAGAALPGAWVDAGTGDQTRFLEPGDEPLVGAADTPMDRSMDSAHLILKAGESTSTSVLELTTGDGDGEDIWEIGRDSACQIVINDGAVSERHAQLVHKGGRWRIVNLVSTNGLFVNDERRLKAYLDDGDRIRLGTSTLAFYANKGGTQSAARGEGGTAGNSSKPLVLLLVAGVAVLLAIGAWVFLA